MSAEDRRAILRILVNMGNLSNGPVNARVNELIQKLRGAINLTRRIIDALATTTTDNTGTEAQLNLLLEIKVLLKFGKKRAVWFYGRLPAIYSALEIYKSRQYQADTSNNVIPNDRYQVAARARTAVLWIDDLTKDLNHILVAVRNNNVRSLQAVSGLSEGPLWKLRDIKTVLLLLLHEVNKQEMNKIADIWEELPVRMMADDVVGMDMGSLRNYFMIDTVWSLRGTTVVVVGLELSVRMLKRRRAG